MIWFAKPCPETLFDVQEKAGFLGTWLGKPYHGKGYNKLAKDSFFSAHQIK
jgi:RimJ/RimL family protein N-acetyltransferase